MANSPPHPWRGRLLWSAAISLGALTLGVGAGAWWLSDHLSGLVGSNLTRILGRPVVIGPVTRLTPDHVEFGPSKMLPQPRDRSSLTIQALEVKFNPWQLICQGQLQGTVNLVSPRLNLVQGTDGRWLESAHPSFPPQGWMTVKRLQISLHQALVRVSPLHLPAQLLTAVAGQATLTPGQLQFSLQGQRKLGGAFRLQGQDTPAAITLRAQVLGVPAASLPPLPSLGWQLRGGEVTGQLRVSSRRHAPLHLVAQANLEHLTVRGSDRLVLQTHPAHLRTVQAVTGTLTYNNSQGRLSLDLQGRLGGPLLVKGWLELHPYRGNLAITAWRLPAKVLSQAFRIPVTIRAGHLDTRVHVSWQANHLPQLQGSATLQGLTAVVPGLPRPLRSGAGKIKLQGLTAYFSSVRTTYGGIPLLARGNLNWQRGFDLQVQTNWVAAPLALAALQINPPLPTRGWVRAPFHISGPLKAPLLVGTVQGDLQIDRVPLPTVRGRFRLEDGYLQVTAIQARPLGGGLVTGRAQGHPLGVMAITLRGTNLAGDQLGRLYGLPPEVHLGPMGGQLRIQGLLTNPQILVNFQAPQGDPPLGGALEIYHPGPQWSATGLVHFPQGLAVIRQAITSQVHVTPEVITIRHATAPGFLARGKIFPDHLQLHLELHHYPLAQVVGFNLAGTTNLQGDLTGPLGSPQLKADLETSPLRWGSYELLSPLRGALSSTPRLVALNLRGAQTRVDLALDRSTLRPEQFFLQRGQAIARGTLQGQDLVGQVSSLPLTSVHISLGGLGDITGIASAQWRYNFPTQTLTGQLQVNQAGLNQFQGASLRGQLIATRNLLVLSDAQLIHGSSKYLLNLKAHWGQRLEVAGQLVVPHAQVQDLEEVLIRGPKPTPGATAADLSPVTIGDPQASLLAQIDTFSHLHYTPQPPLPISPKGEFQGQVTFRGSPNPDQPALQGSFTFQAQDLVWGQARADHLVTYGQFTPQALTIEAFNLGFGGGTASFQGRLGQGQQGHLEIHDYPLALTSQGVDLQGHLEGAINLAGSLTYPQLQGQLSLRAATLNRSPLPVAQATFSYLAPQLQVQGRSLVGNPPQPVTVWGTIPYQLPWDKVTPGPPLDLNLDLRNQALALVNLFTNRIEWLTGLGLARIRAQGSLAHPQISGRVQLHNASFKIQGIPDQITHLDTQITLVPGQVQVKSFHGQLSQGQVTAQGNLPLTPGAAVPTLQVHLERLLLDLPKLYQGQASGDLEVTGSLPAPALGGSLTLSQGRVFLAGSSLPSHQEQELPPLRFHNLKLNLADRLQVVEPPVLDLVSQGGLILDGTLAAPEPTGEIAFTEGGVNLFTSRLELNRRQQNFARFTGSLDPELHLGLETKVTEVTGGSLTSLNPLGNFAGGNSIAVSPDFYGHNLDSLQTIQVYLQVQGKASDLKEHFNQVVTLNSNPSRSAAEIVALLGGGFTGPLLQGNSSLALTTLASSVLFTSAQGLFDRLLSSRFDFRLFPSLIPAENGTSSLSFGGEIAYRIDRQISLSVLQILTGPERPTRFNVNYQLGDHLELRATTNFQGDNIGVLEYRQQF